MSSNNPPHRETNHGKGNNKDHRKQSSANSSNSPHHSSNVSTSQGNSRSSTSGGTGAKAGLKKIFGAHTHSPIEDPNMVPVGVADAVAIPDRFAEFSSPDSYSADAESSSPRLHILNLPENVMENLFTFVGLSDLRQCTLVCVEWNRLLSDENNDVWRSHCIRRMNREVIYSDLLSHCVTYRAKLRAYFHAWNPQDCSRNIYVKPNGFTIHRNPVAQSTDGARGQIGFSKGRHAWEIVWEGPLGTVAVVGIATQQAEMRAQGYIPLLGQDEQSWGWNLVENILLHSGDSQGNYPLINNAPRYQVGEKIRVILDCEDNTLSFEKNFEFLGVAFRGLPNRELLYPAISAVYGNTEVSMVYLGPPLDG